MNKILRKQLLITSLIVSLFLTGCSNNTKTTEEAQILVEYDSHDNPEEPSVGVDDLLGLKSNRDDLYGKKLNYNYLIDNTNVSETTIAGKYYDAGVQETIHYASLARLVDENTITSNIELGDDKTAMSIGTFTSLQIIKCPDSLKEDIIPSNCCNYEINAKKFVTIDNQIYYYITSTVTFKDSIEQYNNHISKDDYLECEGLYQLCDGKFVELSRNQTGLGSEDENISNSNFNNKTKVVIPASETPFKNMKGEYPKEYVLEAIDTYIGEDNYYSPKNDGKDFSEYKKELKNDEQ